MDQATTRVHLNPALTDDKAYELLFADLFRSYEHPLYTLAVRLLKDDFLAKDILQEVFLALWNMREKLNEINNIEAYLFTVTRYKVFKQLQKISTDAGLKEKLWVNLKELVEDGTSTIEAREFHSIIATAIEQLPPKRKQIYILKASYGKTYKDIAEELCISHHTVKNQLSSATEFIRKFLNTVTKIAVLASATWLNW